MEEAGGGGGWVLGLPATVAGALTLVWRLPLGEGVGAGAEAEQRVQEHRRQGRARLERVCSAEVMKHTASWVVLAEGGGRRRRRRWVERGERSDWL